MKYELSHSDRQVAMVLDLNKCLGCHTCTHCVQEDCGTPTRAPTTRTGTTSRRCRARAIPAHVHRPGNRGAHRERRGQARRDAEHRRRLRPRLDLQPQDVLASDRCASGTKEWLRPREEAEVGAELRRGPRRGQYPAGQPLLLPAAALQPLHAPGVPRCLPARGDPQAQAGRHRARRPGSLPRLPLLRRGLSVQEGVLRPRAPGIGEVHLLPAAHRGRRGTGLRAPVPRDGCASSVIATIAEGPIWKLVDKWKVAMPLHPEYGLGPNVFYVPPLSPPKLDADGRRDREPRIPLAYLESLFGPRSSPALDTLLARAREARRGEQRAS
jgi:hypothetical protein